MSGETIKTVLEDVCDNLFNPDPYYQQGGDMVRVGGLQYTCDPRRPWASASPTCAWTASRSRPARRYKVAGWAPVAEGADKAPGVRPVWDVVEDWLRARKGVVQPRQANVPRIAGVLPNPGYVDAA